MREVESFPDLPESSATSHPRLLGSSAETDLRELKSSADSYLRELESLADLIVWICWATTDSTSTSIRLNSSKQHQLPD